MEIDENAFSLSQSCLDFNDGSDSVGAVRVRNGGVLVDGIVTEHKHLLAIEGVFRPSDVRQQTRGRGTIRIAGVLIVDEVDWCDPRQSPRSHKREKEQLHTYGIRAKVVTYDTVHLRKVTTVSRPKVEYVLVTFPH